MNVKHCQFCHEAIPMDQYYAHLQEHLKLRKDGQQTDYATLSPEKREDDNSRFENAPKWYQHKKCGEITGMPEEIIRTYLVKPWFYGAGRTYCCGCERHVPEADCFWVKTGQPLDEYMGILRKGIPRPIPKGFLNKGLFFIGIGINKLIILLERFK